MRDKLGRFIKGNHPSPKTEFKKGESRFPEYQFKKGIIPFAKLHPECLPRRENHWNWRNGERNAEGYICILQPFHPRTTKAGYVRRSHLIVEKYLKRYFLSKERCHHLNEIKSDDRPKNLMAFTSESAHQRFHHNPDNVKPEEIVFDGRKLSNRNCSAKLF